MIDLLEDLDLIIEAINNGDYKDAISIVKEIQTEIKGQYKKPETDEEIIKYYYDLTYNSVYYDNATVLQIMAILEFYENIEDYLACKGIKKALEEIKLIKLSDLLNKNNKK